MVHWIYVLKCEDDILYVGETTRLYRRMFEHLAGNGGANTSANAPVELCAIYQSHRIHRMLLHLQEVQDNNYNKMLFCRRFNEAPENDENDYLFSENFIAEKMMFDRPDSWKNIRGGRYTRFDREYTFPESVAPLANAIPNCHCGYPCDVRAEEGCTYVYFRCARKNTWEGMEDTLGLTILPPCKFYQKYEEPAEYSAQRNSIQQILCTSGWLRKLIGGQYESCVGGCGGEYNNSRCIRYNRCAINFCFNCFLDPAKREAVRKKYDVGEDVCWLAKKPETTSLP